MTVTVIEIEIGMRKNLVVVVVVVEEKEEMVEKIDAKIITNPNNLKRVLKIIQNLKVESRAQVEVVRNQVVVEVVRTRLVIQSHKKVRVHHIINKVRNNNRVKVVLVVAEVVVIMNHRVDEAKRDQVAVVEVEVEVEVEEEAAADPHMVKVLIQILECL